MNGTFVKLGRAVINVVRTCEPNPFVMYVSELAIKYV